MDSKDLLVSSFRGLAIAVAFLFLACSAEEPAEETHAPPAVKTLVVGGEGSGATREYSGSLAAWQHAEMAFEVSGKITEFRAVEGQRVEEGYVLARLDPRDYQAAQLAAEANVAQAKADYERFKKLFEKGVASKAEYDAKTRRYEVTQAELQTAQKAVEDADLVAPFAGVMAKKLVEDFQNVVAKEPVLILQDDQRLKIKVTVPEQDMTWKQSGSVDLAEVTRRIEPKVTVTTLPGSEFDAALHEISMTADPATRTFEATFLMDNPEGVRLLPGMTAMVRIHPRSAASAGIAVPGVAVWADEAGTSYVWKLDPADNTVARTAVEIGALAESSIRILAGLSPGDVIVISGVRTLSEGETVRPLGERLR